MIATLSPPQPQPKNVQVNQIFSSSSPALQNSVAAKVHNTV